VLSVALLAAIFQVEVISSSILLSGDFHFGLVWHATQLQERVNFPGWGRLPILSSPRLCTNLPLFPRHS
jgi:hypothetical protein